MDAGQRLAALKALDDLDITSLFQLTQVDRQIALGRFQHRLQLVEIGGFGVHQIGHYAQTQTSVNGVIQLVYIKAGHDYFCACRIMYQPPPPMMTDRARPSTST